MSAHERREPGGGDLDVERNVVTVKASRPELDASWSMIAAERTRGVFSRQLFLGENLDTDRIRADYREGVLRLSIPVAEKAKPRKIEISRAEDRQAPRRRNCYSAPGQAGPPEFRAGQWFRSPPRTARMV
ncbi:hypothetical protein D7D52_10195 [Nocardia yunnanensis]|uniref:SHSP domain-containing protein n=1 Tax=Nocardia yunnanensis TaxID=2382165 RepID=A0A386Z992_9NOCA|nr:hypothetical protein D7D52_10195 [Nocardia yunnanensis]